jgi:hypothetical protein
MMGAKVGTLMKMGGYKSSDKKSVTWRDNLYLQGTILPRTFIRFPDVEIKKRPGPPEIIRIMGRLKSRALYADG